MSSPSLVVSVPGMTCGHCKAAVTHEIGQIPGVTDVQVDLETKEVVVSGTTNLAAVAAAVEEAGFEISGPAAQSGADEKAGS